MKVKDLHETAEKLFSDRTSLVSFWQEVAENFYPERADFTASRVVGQDFASQLMTSYPIIVRRDLGDAFGSMLRPTASEWFHISLMDEEREDNDAKRWLEWASGTQRRAMYDKNSLFVRATKEGDHDFAAFGQTALSVELNKNADGFLYRCWHLRDVVWTENEEGKIAGVFRKWKPTARDLSRLFPGRVHANVTQKLTKEPFCEFDCMHMVVEADMYDDDARGKPYWSIYYDVTHNHLIEATAVFQKIYVIPRWLTHGSQYAYSPATIAGLPDARLLQAMTATLLEAGEKMTNPPMIGVREALRSDLNIFPGGFTAVDAAYDERMGEVLRPLTQDKSGMPIGIEMQRDSRAMLMQAFYGNKLNLPQKGPEMTAYEIGQRIQEYIRGVAPLFEPMEMDYNGGVCEETFELGLRSGLFGNPHDMPESLQGAQVQFRFESPLHDVIEQQKGQKFLEAKALIADAIALDRSSAYMLDVKVALRDALSGVKVPAKWTRNESTVSEMEQADAQKMQEQQLLANLQAGADVAKTLGEAQPA